MEWCIFCQQSYCPSITDGCVYHSKDYYNLDRITLITAVGCLVDDIAREPPKELVKFRHETGRDDVIGIIKQHILSAAFAGEKDRKEVEE